MRRAVFSFGLLLLAVGSALAAWPSTGRFPSTVTPGPLLVQYQCSPVGLKISPCTSNGSITNTGVSGSNITYVMKFATAALQNLGHGTQTFVKFYAPGSGSLIISQATICQGATSQNCVSTPVPLLFAGNQNITQASGVAGTTFSADPLTFTPQSGAPLTIALNIATGSTRPWTSASATISIPGAAASNYNTFCKTAVGITASNSGTTMTVTVASAGSIVVGSNVFGGTYSANTKVTAFGTGTGGTGTYTVNNSQTVASGAKTLMEANAPTRTASYTNTASPCIAGQIVGVQSITVQ